MKTKPDLGFWSLWNLSFGFFGVQIAYALQSSQVSRIFSTIGADPHDLSYFWILPPLMGFLVQPIIGSMSDRTWNRFGRRLPYLIVGAAVAIVVMCFLPNAGSLGLSVAMAIYFGLFCLMLLDTSINMAMQPFKMLVGDMVNEKQKGLAYSIQSFLCNAGSFVGYLAPFVLAWFVSSTAPEGEVPPTVTFAFYLGAALLLLCVIYTFWKVKELPPHEYAVYNGVPDDDEAPKGNMFKQMASALKTAPKVFWTIGIVQFFCWSGFLYLWTYSTDSVAGHAFNAPVVNKITEFTIDGQTFKTKYLFADEMPVIKEGKLQIAGIMLGGDLITPKVVINAAGDTIIKGSQLFYEYGVAKFDPGMEIAKAGDVLTIDGSQTTLIDAVRTVTRMELVNPDSKLFATDIATLKGDKYEVADATEIASVNSSDDITLKVEKVLNAQSKEYQAAGDWNGVLFAIQAVAALLWASVLPKFKNRRLAYSLSLVIGAAGFISVWLLGSKWGLTVSYALMGCGWAAMLAMPFTILTNALSGKNIGTYLGLFNCTICLPQIIAALLGGVILHLLPVGENGVAPTYLMLVVAGVLMALGALFVWNIKETSGEHDKK